VFILAAALIVAGVALFVAAPLGAGLLGARAKSASEVQVERHEHERALAVQGLRELEFDREMGKLSDEDYGSMHKVLEERALTAMAAAEKIRNPAKSSEAKKPTVTPIPQPPRRPAPAPRRDPVPTLIVHMDPPRPPQQQPPPSIQFHFCPNCGTRAATESKFCAQCGIAIRSRGGAVARTE